MKVSGTVRTINRLEGNEINCSSLSRFYSTGQTEGFAIKFVAYGVEEYQVDNRAFNVNAGSYLLLNKGRQFECNIDCEEPAQGCCITLSEDLIADVYKVLINADEELLKYPGKKLPFPGFHEQVYSTGSPLRIHLRNIHMHLSSGGDYYSFHELFYAIAESLLKEQENVRERIFNITAAKRSTRIELFSRMESGREYLTQNSGSDVSIRDAAKHATLSEFHFCRLFKEAYSVSPYQFLLQYRSEQVAWLIARGHENLADIAVSCGFKDMFSLSRAFRKFIGVTPTLWRAMVYENMKTR